MQPENVESPKPVWLSVPTFFLPHPPQLMPPPDPSRPRASTPPSQQATGITEDLYHRAYTFCTRLLTLPAPYSTVALDCAIRLKTEAAIPGEGCWASWPPMLQRGTTQQQAVFSRMPKSSKLSAPSRRTGVRDPEAGSLMRSGLQVHCSKGLSLRSRT